MSERPTLDSKPVWGIGEEFECAGVPYIVTSKERSPLGNVYVIATAIPDGMTAMDLGRRFHGALKFTEYVDEIESQGRAH